MALDRDRKLSRNGCVFGLRRIVEINASRSRDPGGAETRATRKTTADDEDDYDDDNDVNTWNSYT